MRHKYKGERFPITRSTERVTELVKLLDNALSMLRMHATAVVALKQNLDLIEKEILKVDVKTKVFIINFIGFSGTKPINMLIDFITKLIDEGLLNKVELVVFDLNNRGRHDLTKFYYKDIDTEDTEDTETKLRISFKPVSDNITYNAIGKPHLILCDPFEPYLTEEKFKTLNYHLALQLENGGFLYSMAASKKDLTKRGWLKMIYTNAFNPKSTPPRQQIGKPTIIWNAQTPQPT
jgi:hypothetical protein